jgi:uncharacterized protein (TIGR02271 family)
MPAAAPTEVGQAVATKMETTRLIEKRTDGHAFAEEERTIPVYREELQIGKREVERGTLRVSTHVTEKPSAEQILLREEHIEIERRPVNRIARAGEAEFKETQIEMSEMAEEAIAAKQTRIVEEVVIHKHVAEKTASVGEKLRSTEVDVRSFDASQYRKHFDEQKLGETKFEEHLPAYKFGDEVAQSGGAGRWEEIEAKAKERWEKQRPGTWDTFKGSVRHAWSRANSR